MKLRVTLRDMYQDGTETIILENAPVNWDRRWVSDRVDRIQDLAFQHPWIDRISSTR